MKPSRYYFEIKDENEDVLCRGAAILYDENTPKQIEAVIKSVGKRISMELLAKIGRGDIDGKIRLNLLSSGAKKCILKELKLNPRKFDNFTIIK